MRYVLLGALALALAATPATIQAQDAPAVPRPTVAEVAAGVMACMEPAAGGALVLTAGWDQGVIMAADGPIMGFDRMEPGSRQFGPREHAIADDPAGSSIVMSTDAPSLTPEAIACFEQEYRRLLRP